MIFNRGSFTEIWFRLESNEALGILDTDYIEDYYGSDGQLTLFNTQTLAEYPVLMNPTIDAISGDILTGYILLSSITDGEYTLKGRVRDVLGNYTILTDYYIPDILNTVAYNITIENSMVYSPVTFNGLRIMGGVTFKSLINSSSTLYTTFNSNKELHTLVNKDKILESHLNIKASVYLPLNISGAQI